MARSVGFTATATSPVTISRLVLTLIAGMFVLAMFAAQAAQAQTFSVIHTFRGGADGGGPSAGLTKDPAGNLYGVTSYGGSAGQGNVFKLTRKNSGWVLSSLYSFQGGNDGADPESRVIIGPDGSLYGTTIHGGDQSCIYGPGCGTIFNLRPPATFCRAITCPWTETVLHRFTLDEGGPGGELVFDVQGNLYGTTSEGVFELAPSSGGWAFSLIYQLQALWVSGVILDRAGNLYGAVEQYGATSSVYELTPSPSGWTASVLYTLDYRTDGGGPGGLVFDQAGNLYGGTWEGGPDHGGTVFQLSPTNGGWTFSTLYAFAGSGSGGPCCGRLLMDASGSLYGATFGDGAYGYGSAFKLLPSNGGWIYTDLHDFPLIGSDGWSPNNPLALDSNGNLYGTASGGGANNGRGTVWEITP